MSSEILFGSNKAVYPSGLIDLRKVIDELFFGSSSNPPEAHLVIVRFMKRDSNNNLIRCQFSTSHYTKQNINNPSCPVCLGEGYLFDEKFAWTYKSFRRNEFGGQYTYPMGDITKQPITYYFRYDVPITDDDIIIEAKTDYDGNFLQPIQVEYRYKPTLVNKVKGDLGRIEFIEAVVEHKPNS